MFSKPTYQQLRFDPGGRSHLIAGVANGQASVLRLASQIGAAATTFAVLYDPDPLGKLTEPLQAFLSTARMGLRLYLAGPEAFLWAGMRSATSFGLGKGEVQLELSEQLGRDVYCVRCKYVNRQVLSALHTCIHCGMGLTVRDHFSRRLGCYMGVCAL